MTQPRKTLISICDTPYYHITSRCVRRSFLCGYDQYTHTNYEHRRQWIVERIRLLSSLFAIDIAAYAIMSNHYHLVIKLCPTQVDSWTQREVIERWTHLFKGPLLVQRWLTSQSMTEIEHHAVSEIAEAWRARLTDLSWFMKCLNEPIARQANKEDECTGHFWESRYKSQALRTEGALLTCMAYVELNPIRANMATTLENSDYTSLQERITPTVNRHDALTPAIETHIQQPLSFTLKPLLPFDGNITAEHQGGIPFAFYDYLTLVDWSGRAIRDDKAGHIPAILPPILARLGLTDTDWLENAQHFEARYRKQFAARPQQPQTG